MLGGGTGVRDISEFLIERSEPDCTEEKIHDKFLRHASDYLRGLWRGCSIHRGVSLVDYLDVWWGRPDLIVVKDKEEPVTDVNLGIVEVKVIRRGNSKYERQMVKKRLEQSMPQIAPYFLFFKCNYDIEPSCYLAVKHQNKGSHFFLKSVPIKQYIETSPALKKYVLN